ncbi:MULTISPECIES: hypothetical protein [unclassified Undibacterium]|uniref:hypothetical protein n=1 Tax=unclassified Undibacterium TaxID=2630295 RepID=UPI002AC9AD91|nr:MULTISPECIES: hypothetical protein [unclassified Undibacterium]MEB0140407.1 hypothetical protein [Undibacterium sp. CCC2.1]MEB0171703.1 hypothetical protein [Undibacterium sp. CCC1.1]MEB0177424.1 hypothetical protein [Undibacterium sp. CCC3.4]MEB0215049.1 hypothetical protein [Undibacterium sp. 5I2]WPX45104.1 hypothetical protein RHM61_07740 [Undibacterium sp. CCC3.4]
MIDKKILYCAAGAALCYVSNAMADTDLSIAAALSTYQYREPAVMKNSGDKFALFLMASHDIASEQFIRADVHYATGKVDYAADTAYAAATASSKSDWYLETRALFGRRYAFSGSSLVPFIGLGYRYLSNDLRGFNSLGQSGNRRQSQYIYLPLGLTHSLQLSAQSRWNTELEADVLLRGTQSARLSDAGQGVADVSLSQRHGYGLKISMAYEKDNWSLGPFLEFWDISRSDTAGLLQNGSAVYSNGNRLLYQEPHNRTLEAGLRVRRSY